MKKRILSMLIASVMIFGILPTTMRAMAADIGNLASVPVIETRAVTREGDASAAKGYVLTDGYGHYGVFYDYGGYSKGYWIDKIDFTCVRHGDTWSNNVETVPVTHIEYGYFTDSGGGSYKRAAIDIEANNNIAEIYTPYVSGVYTGYMMNEFGLDGSAEVYNITNGVEEYLPEENDGQYDLNNLPAGKYVVGYNYYTPSMSGLAADGLNYLCFEQNADLQVTLDGKVLGKTDVTGVPNTYCFTKPFNCRYMEGELYRGVTAFGDAIYSYDVKPEIQSVLVNGESVADGGTVTTNNGNVTIKTNYDSKLSDALTAYGCSVKQLSAYYLNGEKINVAMITPVSNGDGTSTKTYSRTLNPGDELTVESWLEVRWPDGSKDRVDEHTVTVSGPSRQFITQPHYAGDGMQTGENYVEWKLNFTPIKLIARYNLGTAARPNWKEVELDATKSRASLPAISPKYTLYAYYGEGARDYVASDAFSATDPVEFTPAFTLQPEDGVSPGGAYAETSWATNFTPVKLQLVKIDRGPNGRPFYKYEELDANATYCTVEPGFSTYCIRAYYNDTEYVTSEYFSVTEMNYYNAWFYVDDTVLDKVMVLEGDYVARPADPVKDGYTFLGWYTDDGELYNFAALVTDDVHLTAKFEQLPGGNSGGNITVKTIGKAVTYTVSGNVVTVTHDKPCKVGYLGGDGKYVTLKGTKNSDGSYSFTAPAGVTEVLLGIKGDISGDGRINVGDVSKLYAHVKQTSPLSGDVLFLADVSGDGRINVGDVSKLYANVKQTAPLTWDT